jgi:hypothetical protein
MPACCWLPWKGGLGCCAPGGSLKGDQDLIMLRELRGCMWGAAYTTVRRQTRGTAATFSEHTPPPITFPHRILTASCAQALTRGRSHKGILKGRIAGQLRHALLQAVPVLRTELGWDARLRTTSMQHGGGRPRRNAKRRSTQPPSTAQFHTRSCTFPAAAAACFCTSRSPLPPAPHSGPAAYGHPSAAGAGLHGMKVPAVCVAFTAAASTRVACSLIHPPCKDPRGSQRKRPVPPLPHCTATLWRLALLQ